MTAPAAQQGGRLFVAKVAWLVVFRASNRTFSSMKEFANREVLDLQTGAFRHVNLLPLASSAGDCPDGVVGLLGSLEGGPFVCCDMGCGECGGFGCSSRPGGAGACCIGGRNGIVETQSLCSEAESAPCIVSLDGKCLGPKYTIV